jgi:hypothetical protein
MLIPNPLCYLYHSTSANQGILEAISKIGFWFKIPSSPSGYAGTGAPGLSFKPEAYGCMSRI